MKTNFRELSAEENVKSHLFTGGYRITILHDNIISHILSGLPTKDAVQTSILSKAWRYKWTTVYKVDVQYILPQPFRTTKLFPFLNFVDRILSFNPYLTSFRLVCNSYYLAALVVKWIDIAITKYRLQSLEIKYNYTRVILPSMIFNSTSLRELKLNVPCILHVPAKNSIPNLISLYLHKVQFENSDSRVVVFNFPVLETLDVRECKWLIVETVEVYAPSLTDLSYGTIGEKESGCSIVIHGAKLAMFHMWADIPENIIIQDGKKVVYAELTSLAVPENLQLFNVGLRVCKMVNGFSNLEELILSEVMARALLQFGLPLDRHDKLERLTVDYFFDIEQLFRLLRAAPSLKYWYTDVGGLADYDYDSMEFVPSCVVSSLEELELFDFTGAASQYNLIKFLFKHGKALKKVSVLFIDDPQIEMRNEVIEHLSALPKCSNCVSVFARVG